MFLALREMTRAKGRFGLLIGAIGLLFFLILTQQALRDGLITSFVGAIRQQTAPVLVYSTDGQKTLQGSLIPPPLEEAIRAVDGAAAAGRIGQGTFTVRIDGTDNTSDAAIIGAEDPGLGSVQRLAQGRRPAAPGEVIGSASDFSVGDRVQIVPVGVPGGSPPELVVVGVADESQLQVTPTLFSSWADYEAAVRAANPEAGTVLPNVIGLRPAADTTAEQLVQAVNSASENAEALTREQAARESPGVVQVRQSFQLIFLLYAFVVPLVTGLFFLIVTLQKSASLTLLRAIGAAGATLVRSLLLQVLAVMAGGVLLGTALYWPLSQQTLGSIVLRFDPVAVGVWTLLLLALGLLSALGAARRVLRIDPIEATTGGGGR